MVYGAALHAAVSEFHRRQQKGEILSDEELAASFERAWTNEGFLSREHEEARLEAGRLVLRRFRETAVADGAPVPAYVEREFAFHLDGDRIHGRWDRVDIEAIDGSVIQPAPTPPAPFDVTAPSLDLTPERVTIVDYKSSAVDDPRIAAARARDSLQLRIYAMGWQAQTGRLPDAVALHFLESGVVGRVTVDEHRMAEARGVIGRVAGGIRSRDFAATPSARVCGGCPYRDICPSSAAR
jgi:hypothetical protein